MVAWVLLCQSRRWYPVVNQLESTYNCLFVHGSLIRLEIIQLISDHGPPSLVLVYISLEEIRLFLQYLVGTAGKDHLIGRRVDLLKSEIVPPKSLNHTDNELKVVDLICHRQTLGG